MSQLIKTKQGIQLSGDFVFANMSALIKEVNLLLETHSDNQLSLLCHNISRIDSAGIAFFIEMKRWCKQQQKELNIQGLPQQAQSLIKTYKLGNVL